MATYTDYPNGLYLDEFNLINHSYYYYGSTSSLTISDFDYANNYLVLIKDSVTSSIGFAFSNTTATMVSSDNNTGYANIYVYEVSSSSFTINCLSGGTYYYWNYFYIPKTTTVIYGTGPSSTGVQNISVPSNIDFTGDVFAILPIYNGGVNSGAIQLKYILYGYYVPYNLVRVNDNATTINGNIATNSANCPIAYFQFTSKLNIPELQIGDVLNYTAGTTAALDFTGCQFSCRLKGNTTSYNSERYAYGANCYAEFDFSSVSDGNITVGSNHGAYIALTNGTGTDINYNRMMVAGDAGGPSYYTDSSGNGHAISAGGNAGLFGGSGSDGSSDYAADSAKGGTQSAGGAKHSSRSEAAANGGFGTAGTNKNASTGSGWSYTYYYSGAGGNGWYGGGGGNARTSSDYCTSGGGSSSYLLTASSYKPTGYFPEWTTYAPLISNGTSELQSTSRDYAATITILAVPSVGPVLPDPSILQRYDATNDQFDPCNIYILKKDITEFETTDLTTPVISQKPSDSSYSPEASTLTPSVGTEELKFASGSFTNTLSVVGSDYSSKTITTDTIYATVTIPLGTSKCYAQMSSSVPSPYCGYTLKVYNGSTFDTIVDNDRHTTPIDITSSISVGTTNLFEFSVSMSGSYQFDSASDYMKLVLLPETGETNTFQVCALYRYDSTNDEFVKIGG